MKQRNGIKKINCITFILTPKSKSKSEHSNLKKKNNKSKQTRRTNTKQKRYKVEPIQAFLWIIKGPNCLSGRWYIYSQQNRWFSNKLVEPFAKWPFLSLFICQINNNSNFS